MSKQAAAQACPPCRVGVTRRAALKLERVVIRAWAGMGRGRGGCSGVMAWGLSDALSGMFASKAEGVHACGLHWCLCCLASLAIACGLVFLAAGTEVVGAADIVVFVSLSERGRVMVLRQCITSPRPFLGTMPATLHRGTRRSPWPPWSRSSPTRPRVERPLHVEMWLLPVRPSCRRMYLIRLHSLPALLAALAQSAFIHSPVFIPCQVTGPEWTAAARDILPRRSACMRRAGRARPTLGAVNAAEPSSPCIVMHVLLLLCLLDPFGAVGLDMHDLVNICLGPVLIDFCLLNVSIWRTRRSGINDAWRFL